MTAILYLQLNFLLIIVMSIMYKSISGKLMTRRTPDQEFFRQGIVVLIITVVFDSGMWFFDGLTFPGAIAVNLIVSLLYLLMNPLVCLIWTVYADYKVYGNINGIKKRVPYYAIPVVINTIILLLSLFNEWIFYIDGTNRYHRGVYSIITPITCLAYFVIICSLIIVKKHISRAPLSKDIYVSLLLFPVAPIIATVIQVMRYGLSLIWAGATVSVFLLFINLQNNKIYTDKLTGVYKREYMNTQLNNAMNYSENGRRLFLICIDLDKFKSINDNYGHIAGDRMLKATADLLLDACANKYNIARYGGDEFLVYGKCGSNDEVEALIGKIEQLKSDYNAQSGLPYEMRFSMGMSIEDGQITLAELLKRADSEMYKHKKSAI